MAVNRFVHIKKKYHMDVACCGAYLFRWNFFIVPNTYLNGNIENVYVTMIKTYPETEKVCPECFYIYGQKQIIDELSKDG